MLSIFESLLNRNESDTVDFKMANYSFDGESEVRKRKRAQFVKDIISLANTPRNESAYIVLGVKSNVDGTKEHVGVGELHDDADLQSKLSEMCHPHPPFKYEPLNFQGKKFALIVIPNQNSIGPFLPTKDQGDILRRHAVYYRRNSQNAQADGSEQRRIYDWFKGQPVNLPEDFSGTVWDQFSIAVHNFESLRKYILIASPGVVESGGPIENLSNVPWLYVFDFDSNSNHGGLLGRIHEQISARQSLHKVTIDSENVINSHGATYWYFARGMEGRASTLSTGSWLDWSRKYSRELRNRLVKVAGAITNPVTIVVLWEAPELNDHLKSLLEYSFEHFGESVDVVMVSSFKESVGNLYEQFQSKLFNLPLPHFFHGLQSIQNNIESHNSILFPSGSGADIKFDQATINWFKEELGLVHKNIGIKPDGGNEAEFNFLRGNEITWFELSLHIDVDRDITDKIKKIVKCDLEKRSATRINIYHAPGAGGTTISRRILWEFRKEWPVVILLRMRSQQTVERMQKIFSETGLPLLIEVDGSRISDGQSDELYRLLSAGNIPFVMLQILRRFEAQCTTQRAFYLDGRLGAAESARFVATLSKEKPDRKKIIESSSNSLDDKYRTPFYFGLVAFERDFSTIDRYISSHLNALNEVQKRIVTYMAIAHYYAQQPISEQSFAGILGTPPNQRVDLHKALPEAASSLIFRQDDGYWRPVHQLVAEELIQQVLSSRADDKRIWKSQLADWAIDFIEFCNRGLPEHSEESIELLRRIFIYRNESENVGSDSTAGKMYSLIITDIPVTQGKERVLQHLASLFPEEAHFWAHLARFHSIELRDYDKAVEIANRALEIEPNDFVLHHMKGMVCKSKVQYQMQQGSTLDEVLVTAKNASASFAKAREINPDGEHAYISEAQLIIKMIDYAGKVAGSDPLTAVSRHGDSWIRESFQYVEDLLFQVRKMLRDKVDSGFEKRCQAELDNLYGRHESALQIWDNLLSRKGHIYAPPIRRQIVWALLARKDRSWSRMLPKEIERSVTLLEDNIKEEPNDERNIRLWIQAIRFQRSPPSVEAIVERIAYWASNTDTLEANYYLYVLHTLLAINGSTVAIDQALRAMERCKEKSRYKSERTWSYEWLGNELGMKQLVHHSRLGEWDRSNRFWEDTSALMRVEGVIASISGPQAGVVELASGMKAFFVPGVSGHAMGRSENTAVTFFLGFSYDGLRAWSVENA